MKHEKASGLEDLDSSVQNIQYVLQNNSWEVCVPNQTFSHEQRLIYVCLQVKDVPGDQEVVLTKKFGNEE